MEFLEIELIWEVVQEALIFNLELFDLVLEDLLYSKLLKNGFVKIGTGRLTIYEGISRVGGKYVQKGKKVIVMNGGNAEFNDPLNALEGLQLFSSEKLIVGGFEGQSKVVHFNNNTWLRFTCGQDIKGNTFGR